MERRRPRPVQLGAAFLALTSIGFGVIIAFVLFPDPLLYFGQRWRALEGHAGQEALRVQLAQRFHWRSNEQPCLRYPHPIGEEAQTRDLARRLVGEGFAPHAERLVVDVRRWDEAHQHRHHLFDAHHERYAFLSERLHGVEGFILRINRGRILRALRRRGHARSPTSGGMSSLLAEGRKRFRRIWRRHKAVLEVALGKSRELVEGDSRTDERMGRVVREVKRWVSVYGVPPRSLDAMPTELRDDGFGSPFYYEQSARGVWLISTGGDGLWGTADDRIWGLHR